MLTTFAIITDVDIWNENWKTRREHKRLTERGVAVIEKSLIHYTIDGKTYEVSTLTCFGNPDSIKDIYKIKMKGRNRQTGNVLYMLSKKEIGS